jgi:hypothetical protein
MSFELRDLMIRLAPEDPGGGCDGPSNCPELSGCGGPSGCQGATGCEGPSGCQEPSGCWGQSGCWNHSHPAHCTGTDCEGCSRPASLGVEPPPAGASNLSLLRHQLRATLSSPGAV